MEKQDFLHELSWQLSTGGVTRQEVVSVLDALVPSSEPEKKSIFSVTNIMYVLGATIVVVGIIFFVGQLWNDIGSFGRILVTFGMGILMAGLGSTLLKQKLESNLGVIFHFMGGVLIPGGMAVLLDEFGLDSNEWVVAMMYVIIFGFYLFINKLQKNAVLTFFAIANGTIAGYLLLYAIVGDPYDGWFGIRDIYEYLTMLFGVGYLLLGYKFQNDWNQRLVGVLYFFGTLGLLGAAFTIMLDIDLWEFLYFFLVLGCLFLSIKLQSRSVLAVSTMFILAYVTYITSEYFADSLGWPISLILLGFVFIGLGYGSLRINKKYIAQ